MPTRFASRLVLLSLVTLGLAGATDAQDLDGDLIGVVWFRGLVWEIDSTTGASTRLEFPRRDELTLNSLARSPDGRLVAGQTPRITGGGGELQLVEVDLETREVVPIAPLTLPGILPGIRSLAFHPDGSLYGTTGSAVPLSYEPRLIVIELETGEWTEVGPIGGFVQALDFTADGTLYGWDISRGLVTLDLETGVATPVNPTPPPRELQIQTLLFLGDGRLIGIREQIFELDTDTGAATLIGGGVGFPRFRDLRGVEMIRTMPTVDVRPPGGQPINVFSAGMLPVAILGSRGLDVEDIDRGTLAFGPAGAAPANRGLVSYRDVNDDGFGDLLAFFRIPETGIALGDSEACIEAVLLDETALLGCDAIDTRGRGQACGLGFELALVMVPLVRRLRLRAAG